MKTVARKWGNGAYVWTPAAVMRAARLELDQAVNIRAEGGSIIIDRLRSASHDLAALLDGITEDNLHGEVSTGDAVGRNVW